MPLYEYRCKKCGHQFEKIQSFSAPDVKECPNCKGEVERLISAPSFQFKGSGWYETDYGAKSHAKPSSASAESSGDGKPAAPAESKPAAAAATSSPASASATSTKSE
ncbi:MAG: zinc ribbon domain-containing protein [Acidobacteriaceae bacterium]